MNRRMIFIGLGGSGGKTIRFLKREIKRWLKQSGWEGDIPVGWQFLHIDSPTAQDGTSVEVDMLPNDEYLGLVGPGVGFSGIVKSLDSVSDSELELEGWRVDPAALGVPVGQGAGQFRAVGRTIALAYLREIRIKLQGMLERVNDSGATAELQQLMSEVKGVQAAGLVTDPLVVVVSSLAGGTGAGLFMDVCDLLREMAPPWGGNSFALLYTPEVFESLGGGATGGVQPNSLAAISELMNGHWLHGGVVGQSAIPPRSSVFHTRAGAASPVGRSGPAFPMLIGKSGGAQGVSFGTDLEVFEMVGRALMSWATDTTIQSDFLAYEIDNWTQAATGNQVLGSADVIANSGGSSAPKEAGDPMFSSLGFSRVSLGNDYFEEYSAKRIAFDGVRWALEAVRISSNAEQHLIQDASLTDNQIAELIAKDYLDWFLRATKLHERGPEQNDVLEDLFPKTDWQAAVTRMERKAIDLTGITTASSEEIWNDALSPAIRQVQILFYDEVRPLVEEKIREWVIAVQDNVVRMTEDAIARHGLHVARALLDAAIVELSTGSDSVSKELRGEASTAESYSQNWEAQIRAALGQTPGKIGADNPAVQKSVTDSINYATQNLYGYLIDNAATLLDELALRLLQPLRNSVSGAISSLELELPVLSDWPAWDGTAVPKSLRPPRSEVTVLDPDDFPATFGVKLAETIGGQATATGSHRDEVRRAVMSGTEVRRQLEQADSDEGTLLRLLAIDPSNKWWPGGVLPQEGRAPTNALFNTRFSSGDLVDRSSHWLNRTGTAFHDIFSASLSSYTAPDMLAAAGTDPAVFAKRQQKFLACFTKARAQSRPLIKLNANLLTQLHPRTDIEVRVSTVPFSGHPLQNEVVEQLQILFGDASNTDALVASAMSTDKNVKFIDIMSTLQAPVSPLVIDSLFGPISSAWNAANSSHISRDAFWAHRRTRTLMEFVPLPVEHINAIVRGFFTARMLGLLEKDGGKILIRTPRGGVVSFPQPLLRNVTDSKDLLPALLESLPLAMVRVQTIGTVAPLEAYAALRDFGWQTSGQKASQIYEFDRPAPVLAHWLETGKVEGLVDPIKSLRHHTDPKARRDAMVEFLDTTLRNYQEGYDDYRSRVNETRRYVSQDPDWPGLWPVISSALGKLITAVRTADKLGFDEDSM